MLKIKKESIYSNSLLLLLAVVWGSGFIVSKLALSEVKPLFLIAGRFLIAAIATSIAFSRLFKRLKKEVVLVGMLLAVFMVSGFVLQTYGLQATTASKNAFLTSVHVVVVPFLYWIIGKGTPHWKNLLSSLVCIAGIFLLTLNESFRMSPGDLLSLLSGIAFSFHIACLGVYSKKYDPLELTLCQLIFAAVFALIIAFALEPLPTAISLKSSAGIIYLGLVCTFLGYLLQNVAQKYTTPSHTSVMICLESPFGSVMSVIFLSEVLSGRAIFGCILMLLSVLISQWDVGNKKKTITNSVA